MADAASAACQDAAEPRRNRRVTKSPSPPPPWATLATGRRKTADDDGVAPQRRPPEAKPWRFGRDRPVLRICCRSSMRSQWGAGVARLRTFRLTRFVIVGLLLVSTFTPHCLTPLRPGVGLLRLTRGHGLKEN